MSQQVVDTFQVDTVKKSFNIFLNSMDTSSYNGYPGNANYYVSFGNIITAKEMDRPYKVTVRFKSRWATAAGYATNDNLYFLSVNFLNQTRVQQNTGFSQICAILSRYQESNVVDGVGVNPNFQYECFFPDNPPVYLDNLRDISQLNVKILYDDMKQAVNPSFPNYAMILNFEQV